MSEIDTRPVGGNNMRALMLIGIAGLMLVAAAAASPTTTAGAKKLVVVMRDPGCHWFYLGGGPDHRKYAKKVIRHGAVKLLNLDEAALRIKGPGGTKTDPVGAKLRLRRKGVYRITMVHQARHDNTLKLTIK